VASNLIGQPFSDPQYFWGRLSSTGGESYNASASGGSNYSVLNEALLKQVRERIDALHAVDPGNTLPIPVDLVTASASGLDPHISPSSAYYQISRIARLRNLPEEQVRTLVDNNIEEPFLGMIGQPRVNVLKLNLALESLQ
ncbi:potassium-transporting ATPase subunit KdpC, partial [bacterium]